MTLADVPEDQLLEFRDAFSLFDNDKGVISHKDILSVMRKLGENPSKQEVLKMIEPIDKNGDRKIEFHEFVDMMKKYIHQHQDGNHNKDVITHMFNVFDKNQNGFICSKELRKMMKTLGQKLSQKQLDEMMKFADRNGDGHIDYDEFKHLAEDVLLLKNQNHH